MAQLGALACTERMDIHDHSGPCAAGTAYRIKLGDDGVLQAWDQTSQRHMELKKSNLFRTVNCDDWGCFGAV